MADQLEGPTSHLVSSSPIKRNFQSHIKWTHPPTGSVKVNFDSVSKSDSSLAAAACVIRDSEGKWLLGKARNLGKCSSILAELWAIYIGLHLAWECGFMNILESDPLLLAQALSNHTPLNDTDSILLERCKELLRRDWMVQVSHIFSEANHVADGVQIGPCLNLRANRY